VEWLAESLVGPTFACPFSSPKVSWGLVVASCWNGNPASDFNGASTTDWSASKTMLLPVPGEVPWIRRETGARGDDERAVGKLTKRKTTGRTGFLKDAVGLDGDAEVDHSRHTRPRCDRWRARGKACGCRPVFSARRNNRPEVLKSGHESPAASARDCRPARKPAEERSLGPLRPFASLSVALETAVARLRPTQSLQCVLSNRKSGFICFAGTGSWQQPLKP